jgi:hypothetical protein
MCVRWPGAKAVLWDVACWGNSNAVDFHLGSAHFKYCLGHCLSWLRFLMIFLQPSRYTSVWYPDKHSFFQILSIWHLPVIKPLTLNNLWHWKHYEINHKRNLWTQKFIFLSSITSPIMSSVFTFYFSVFFLLNVLSLLSLLCSIINSLLTLSNLHTGSTSRD